MGAPNTPDTVIGVDGAFGYATNGVTTSWRFFQHIGLRPSSSHSVDRFPDHNGNYEPGNVRWATIDQQCSNRRSSKLNADQVAEIHADRTSTLKQVSGRYGISVSYASNIRTGLALKRKRTQQLSLVFSTTDELTINRRSRNMARTATKTAPARKKSIKIDMTGVETASVIPEGEYIAEVTKASQESSDGGNDYIAWELKIVDGKQAGKKVYNNTSLQPQSLWATKRFLECLGVEVPDGVMELSLDDMVGLQVGIVIEHGTYKGKTQSKVIDTYPAESEGEGDKDTGGDAAETGELPDEDAINEMGKAELAELVKEHDLDVELDGTTAKQRRAVIAAVKAKSEEAEEEAEAKSAKGAAKSGTKAAPAKASKRVKIKADDVTSMDEEELAELIEKHDLDVDLDKFATTRRKRSAVVDSLEAAELLADDE